MRAVLIFQQEVTSGSQDSAGVGPWGTGTPMRRERRQQVNRRGWAHTSGAWSPSPVAAAAAAVPRERPSLSLSVSTAPASALLCDRLTLPARRGGSPAQGGPGCVPGKDQLASSPGECRLPTRGPAPS